MDFIEILTSMQDFFNALVDWFKKADNDLFGILKDQLDTTAAA